MTNIKNTILSGWHFMRWFRLMMALVIGYEAVDLQNIWLGLMAGLFLYQALFNAACCGPAGNCTVERRHKNDC